MFQEVYITLDLSVQETATQKQIRAELKRRKEDGGWLLLKDL